MPLVCKVHQFVIKRWMGYFFKGLGFTLREVALLPFMWRDFITLAFFCPSFEIAASGLSREGVPVQMLIFSSVVSHIWFMSCSLIKWLFVFELHQRDTFGVFFPHQSGLCQCTHQGNLEGKWLNGSFTDIWSLHQWVASTKKKKPQLLCLWFLCDQDSANAGILMEWLFDVCFEAPDEICASWFV